MMKMMMKMNILPKFLYLFQYIPLAPPGNFFDKIKTLFCNFIWNGRRSRLRMTLLHLPYDRGGLKIPFLQGYYWAAQLRAASYWFEHHSPLHWIRIYIYSANLATLKKHTANPFVRNTLIVAQGVKLSWGKCSIIPILTKLFRKDSPDPLWSSWINLKVLSDYHRCSKIIFRG